MAKTWVGLANLFKALNNDDAMLMLVSQLVTQAGLFNVIPVLFTHRNKDNWDGRIFNWALLSKGNFINPSIWKPHKAFIDTTGTEVKVKAVMEPRIFTSTNSKEKQSQPMECDMKQLQELGITNFKIILEVALKRNGNKIDMRTSIAEIKCNVT